MSTYPVSVVGIAVSTGNGTKENDFFLNERFFFRGRFERTDSSSIIIIIILYFYDAVINALSAHMIHINLNTIFYTHVEDSLTKTICIR